MVSVSDDAEKWLDNTQDSENYAKWEGNTQAAVNGQTTTAGEGLARRYDGVSESDVSNYEDKWERETQRAIDNDAYEGSVENLSEEDWSSRFLQGITS